MSSSPLARLCQNVFVVQSARGWVAGRDCPLCGASGTPVGSYESVCLRSCCDSLLAWAWQDESEYYAWYQDPEAYPVIEQRANQQLPFLERIEEQRVAASARLKFLTALGLPRSSGTVLDVGAGTGAFVEVARMQYGYQAEGLEPCSALVKAAGARHLPIRQGGWQAATDQYGVITLFDVLEHLTHPFECLIHLGSHLEQGGILMLEMPEWDSPQQRSQGLEWKHIRPRQHLWLPSRKAAEYLFMQAGYEVIAFYRPLCGALGKASWILMPA